MIELYDGYFQYIKDNNIKKIILPQNTSTVKVRETQPVLAHTIDKVQKNRCGYCDYCLLQFPTSLYCKNWKRKQIGEITIKPIGWVYPEDFENYPKELYKTLDIKKLHILYEIKEIR